MEIKQISNRTKAIPKKTAQPNLFNSKGNLFRDYHFVLEDARVENEVKEKILEHGGKVNANPK